jgi:transposase
MIFYSPIGSRDSKISWRYDSDKTTALRLLGTTSPRVRSPWLAAEAFQQIYVAESTEQFEGLLDNRATHSQLAPIIKVAKTIKRHWDGIVSWKKSQINNGYRFKPRFS